MRLAMIYDKLFPGTIGGVELQVYFLATHLVKHIEVTLCSDDTWVDNPTSAIPGVKNQVLFRRRAATTKRRNHWGAIRYAIAVARHALTAKEDVWETGAMPFLHLPLLAFIAKWRGKKLVVVWAEWWGEYWRVALPTFALIGQWVERIAVRLSPIIVVYTHFTKKRMLEQGVAEEKIFVVECGVPIDQIERIEPANESTSLISLGRLVPHKRFDLAIRALAHLPNSVTLTIVGDGPERENLHRLARHLNLESRVFFHPFASAYENGIAKMKRASVLVQPSAREGFGLTIVEGWACGIPCVVCEAPFNASASLIHAAHEGVVVPPTAVAIAKACEQYLSSPKEGDIERRRARAREYAWPQVAEAMLQVYRR